MKPHEYISSAMVTAAPGMKPNMVKTKHLFALVTAIESLALLADHIKRAMFYGKPISDDVSTLLDTMARPYARQIEDAMASNNINPQEFFNEGNVLNNEEVDAIHAALGVFTEGSELLLAVFNEDNQNVREELGDVFWYLALMHHTIGRSFEESWAQNIAKLKARYPDKFSEYQALNRDLVKEEAALTAQSPNL